MSDVPERTNAEAETAFSRRIGAKAERKLQARRRAQNGIWFGFAMTGLVGWSVVVPTLLGTALGVWLDHHYPGTHSWTLTLLILGLVLGCWNAWHWVAREEKKMRDELEQKNE